MLVRVRVLPPRAALRAAAAVQAPGAVRRNALRRQARLPALPHLPAVPRVHRRHARRVSAVMRIDGEQAAAAGCVQEETRRAKTCVSHKSTVRASPSSASPPLGRPPSSRCRRVTRPRRRCRCWLRAGGKWLCARNPRQLSESRHAATPSPFLLIRPCLGLSQRVPRHFAAAARACSSRPSARDGSAQQPKPSLALACRQQLPLRSSSCPRAGARESAPLGCGCAARARAAGGRASALLATALQTLPGVEGTRTHTYGGSRRANGGDGRGNAGDGAVRAARR
jgi:hypothetical protein